MHEPVIKSNHVDRCRGQHNFVSFNEANSHSNHKDVGIDPQLISYLLCGALANALMDHCYKVVSL